MLRQITGEVSLFAVGGGSYLGLFKNARLTLAAATQEASPASRIGKKAQPVTKGSTLTFSVMSNKSGSSTAARVTVKDVTSFAIGGTDLRGHVQEGTLSGRFGTKEGAGWADVWDYPNVTDKDFEFDGSMMIPIAGGGGLVLIDKMLDPATLDDLAATFALTVDGIAIQIPMTVDRVELGLQDKDLQLVSTHLMGASPDTGAYPTLPTATGTVLEKVLVTPYNPLAFQLQSRATYGKSFEGEIVPTSVAMRFRRGELVMIDYSFVAVGAVAPIAA
jgi:hypothetical protein